MAKRRKSSTARALAPVIRMQTPPAQRVVVAQPSFLGRTQAKMQSGLRRVGGAAAKFAQDEKHTLTAVSAAALLGLAESRGMQLPAVDAVGTAGTYGIAAFVVAKLTGNRTAEHVATGLLSVAAYKAASKPPAATAPAGTAPGVTGRSGRV